MKSPIEEECEHEVVKKHCFNCRFTEKYGMKIEMFNKHHYVRLKDVERAFLAGEKKGAEGVIEKVEEICELHKNIEERTHRVGSHSDDYGGESDYPCDCDNEKRWHKIEAISSILYALQALKTNPSVT